MPEGLDPSTLAVTAGRPHQPGDPVNTPVFLTSTYRADGAVGYGRDGNPTWSAFEEAVGALEGGTAVAFASGLAAIAAVLEELPVGAAVVCPADAYNGTRRFLADVASRGRFEARLVDISDTEATLAACDGAALLWIESPTNPMMRLADISQLAAGGRRLGCRVAVDNTFATPLVQRPLDLGADVAVHSATKFLAGHSDLIMGVAVARDDTVVESLRRRRSLHGATPSAFEAFLALRGVRTLAVRMERASASAEELVERLRLHPAVEAVHHPGFGAVLSFEVAGGAVTADAVCAATRIAVHGTSLGGVETLLERRNRWVGEEDTPPGVIRMSVGIEHVEDLWADLAQALDRACATR